MWIEREDSTMAKDTAKAETKKKAAPRPASERAQEALDVAKRNVERAQARLDAAKATISELEGELTAATKKRDYAALNPDLPEQPVEPAAVPVPES